MDFSKKEIFNVSKMLVKTRFNLLLNAKIKFCNWQVFMTGLTAENP